MSASNIYSISTAVLEQNPIGRSPANSTSQKAAIKAKCAKCFGCSSNHLERGFRASVSECLSYSYPLHSFGSFQA